MEQWLKDNIFQIIVVLGGGVFAFFKLYQFQNEALKWRDEFMALVKKLQEDIDVHVQASTPHSGCLACSAIMLEIKGILGSINARLNNIDDRIFTISTGYVKDKKHDTVTY